ncbi:MAG TPA: SMP-30/gluconolactonase/LRE family protein [Rubrivivax sp.]|nr:SMP-30/gluconolactonase/LRE family protein [Rubrivivax sp.]
MTWTALPVAPSLLGESPFWHPDEAALYWADIAGLRVNRFHPASGEHGHWTFDSEPGCCAPVAGGGLLVATRQGLFRLHTHNGHRRRIAKAPYNTELLRFNDGRADPQGRFWCTSLYEPRGEALAALYRWDGQSLQRMAGDVTVGNGLAFSPDGATMYWSDTSAHRIFAFDFDRGEGRLGKQRVFAEFPAKAQALDLAHYGGRPDGAAVDVEGCYWVAMYEGQRLLRIAPDGRVLQELPLPVRCPTMPCFGGTDLCTLYVTTARDKRPADELAAQPLAGCVLQMRVSVPGLPVNFVAESP